jgi:hypothetical protein
MMHLISEMPDPAAYGAKALTKLAAVKAKSVCKDDGQLREGCNGPR